MSGKRIIEGLEDAVRMSEGSRLDEMARKIANEEDGIGFGPNREDISYLLEEVKRLEGERDAAYRALALHHSEFQCPECHEVIENGTPHAETCSYFAADMAARKMGDK